MYKYYVHIGMPRCASTFIQRNYFPNHNILYLNDYLRDDLYPEVNFMFNDILYSKNYNLIHKKNKASFLNVIHSLADKKNTTTIVLSSEELVGFYSENFNNYNDMFLNLQYLFDNLKVIFIFREQSSFLESLYRLSIRQGFWSSINDFLNYKNNKFNRYIFGYRMNVSIETFNWYNLWRFYSKNIGKENVLFLPLEQLKYDEKTFFRSLNQFLCVDEKKIKLDIVNESYSYIALVVLRFLNRFTNNGRNPIFFILQAPFNIILSRYKYDQNVSNKITILKKINSKLYIKHWIRPFNLIKIKRKFINDKLVCDIQNEFKSSNMLLEKELSFNLKQYGYYSK